MPRIKLSNPTVFRCSLSVVIMPILIVNAFLIHASAYSWSNRNVNGCNFYKRDSLLKDSLSVIEISGIIKNNFHEYIDSIEVLAVSDRYRLHSYSNDTGLFTIKFPVEQGMITENIHLSFQKYDYNTLDTNIVITYEGLPDKLNIILIPKYKILLKGRLFAGNTPVEDVDVNIRYRNESLQLKTLKCYTDEEKYWNCLYLGMFKTEIVADNPEDSVYLSFSKSGFKSQSYKLRFADYSGDILRFRMKYADTIPDLPGNNLSLKLSYPIGENSGWFLGLSFYGKLNYNTFNRIRPGLEISMSTRKRSVSMNTLPGTSETKFDTVYTDFFIGPSFLFFITKPHIRRFSTYLGSTFSLTLGGGEFVWQPFLGTRYYIDMRRSICLDFRYLSYKLNAKNYSFNYNGDAIGYNEEISVKRILANIGVQINF